MEVATVPVILFILRSKLRSDVICHTAEGIEPDILLSPARNHVRPESPPTELGMLDESMFESNLTARKFTDKPIVEGMGPVSLLPLNESCSKFRWKMLGGIVEVRLLDSSKISRRPGIFPREEGIGPEMLQF